MLKIGFIICIITLLSACNYINVPLEVRVLTVNTDTTQCSADEYSDVAEVLEVLSPYIMDVYISEKYGLPDIGQ